jgi:hypothetical protein
MDVFTQHGYDAVLKLGEAARRRYIDGTAPTSPSEDLGGGKPLSSSSKTGSLMCNYAAIYCEEGMARDEKTAEAFFKGMGCQKTPTFHYEDADFIIDQGSAPRGDSGECTLLTEAETEGRVGGGLGAAYQALPQYGHLLDKLNTLLGCCAPALCDREGSKTSKEKQQQEQLALGEAPSSSSSSTPAAAADSSSSCTISDLGSHWDEHHWYTTFEGPLYAGKYFGEWFLLNYLNGMEYAWGELTPEEVLELASFVTLYRSFEFDLPAAKSFGSALLSHIAATLQLWSHPTTTSTYSSATSTSTAAAANSAATTDSENLARGAVGHGAKAKLVYYAAHDTNLLFLAELLGLKWLSKGGWQPNHTPPGGQLVFEVFGPSHPMNNQQHDQEGQARGESSGWTVALFFDTQTPAQIRDLTDLTFE